MRFVRAAAPLVVALLLVSCAATRKNVGGWLGEPTPTPSPKPKTSAATGAQKPKVYYAGIEGLKAYSESSASSQVVGTLSLNEKVMRSKVERGFAFVESTKSGVKGWVDNAQLRWRPATAVPAPGEARPEEARPEEVQPEEAPAEERVAPTVEETQHPAAPEPTAAAAAPEPTATPMPTEPTGALPTPRPLGPSIFNPY